MKDNLKVPFFIDFEASSLDLDSYPIEVAWGSEIANIRSYLISPREISRWRNWSFAAQRIHRIDKDTLLRDGYTPQEVAIEIKVSLENRIVYSDNPDYDGMWMKALFDATNSKYPKMNILHFDSLLIQTVCLDTSKRIAYLPKILEFKIQARKIIRIQHRAAYDVAYLIKTWEIAKQFSKVKNFHL